MGTHGPRQPNDLYQELAALLPPPVEIEAIGRLIGGEPAEVIVTVSPTTVTVEAYAARWNGPHELVTAGRQVGVFPLPTADEPGLLAAVKAAIGQARAIRLATYRTCTHCGQTNPPEWMHDQTVCQTCAERDLGVVY